MKKLFILLLSALSLTAFAQQKVAVYVTGKESGINKVLGDQLVAAFTKSGKYMAIERTASFLAEMRKEQNYQTTGAVDDSELSRLGVQFGVNYVCVADVCEVFGEKYVSARLIDVETAEVVNTANVSSPMSSMNELLDVTNTLAQDLTSKTRQERVADAWAEKKSKEDTEKMLLEGFANGYIKCGNLYITISFPKIPWSECSSAASSCRVGGFSDWRVPTSTELSLVMQACRNYYANKDFYPKIPEMNMEQLKPIFTYEGYYYYFWIKDNRYLRANGRSEKLDIVFNCSLLLVRDAK